MFELRIEPGQRFAGRFLVEGLLGEGGMGAVYRAVDLALGERVALKVLSLRASTVPSATQRFRQEVRLARRVTHPNVVRVYDLGEHEERLYLTMELVEGQTLREVLRGAGRLSLGEGARIGRALCEGLSAVHALGIVHRDLKPTNVMIEPSGRVLVTDFGIAFSTEEDAGLTREGAMVGTPRYMAPEQVMLRRLDARADMFAVGLMLHEMVAGRLPEALGEAIDLEAEGVSGPQQVLARLTGLIRRCVAMDPADRPRSVEEVGHALAEIAAAAGATGESVRPSLRSSSVEIQRAGMETTLGVGERAVAVLPFRYVGPPELEYLGGTLADELVDLLARSRGIKVLATGATAPFVAARDPVAMGAALGVFVV
ncbi:MAG TPA: serine/threonine-protein kinase, partial [Candidatus Nanopelagicales bacterium]|nr:serine/threonine-protein kinase [Candidatus Nanopelagicales bacterium]